MSKPPQLPVPGPEKLIFDFYDEFMNHSTPKGLGHGVSDAISARRRGKTEKFTVHIVVEMVLAAAFSGMSTKTLKAVFEEVLKKNHVDEKFWATKHFHTEAANKGKRAASVRNEELAAIARSVELLIDMLKVDRALYTKHLQDAFTRSLVKRWWLERIPESGEQRFSVGWFIWVNGELRYNGMAYPPVTSIVKAGRSLPPLSTWRTTQLSFHTGDLLLYAYERFTERDEKLDGDGFGAIKLEAYQPGDADLSFKPVAAWFVDIEGQIPHPTGRVNMSDLHEDLIRFGWRRKLPTHDTRFDDCIRFLCENAESTVLPITASTSPVVKFPDLGHYM